jgi:hypothetical protein
MLVCEQCGCSGELGMGWLSVVRIDTEVTQDARLMVEYCQPCADIVFGSRRHDGRRYVPHRANTEADG